MSLSICQFVAIAYDSSVSKSLIVQLNDLFYRRGGEGKKERSNLSEAIIHSANRFGLLLLERNILINLNAKFVNNGVILFIYWKIFIYIYISAIIRLRQFKRASVPSHAFAFVVGGQQRVCNDFAFSFYLT